VVINNVVIGFVEMVLLCVRSSVHATFAIVFPSLCFNFLFLILSYTNFAVTLAVLFAYYSNNFMRTSMDTFDQFPQQNPGQSPYQPYPQQYPERGRGTMILLFGILGLLCLGPFLGIPAWVMGNTDMKKIKQNLIAPSEYGNTHAGKILGIIGTFISMGSVVIFGIAMVVGINLFQASSVDANRNALISDLNNLGAMSQQYYRKPASLGGGGESFIGWTIPSGLSENSNGSFTVDVYYQKVIITGVGIEHGDNGSKIVHVAVVTPTSIVVTRQN
jgi:hypothetical protein